MPTPLYHCNPGRPEAPFNAAGGPISTNAPAGLRCARPYTSETTAGPEALRCARPYTSETTASPEGPFNAAGGPISTTAPEALQCPAPPGPPIVKHL